MRAWLPRRKRRAWDEPAAHEGPFARFTPRARRAVVLAQEEARELGHNYIGTEHLLLGLLREGEGVAARALGSLGMTLEAARQQAEETIGRGQQPLLACIPFTPRAKKVLQLSLREAMRLGHLYIGTEHLLLGLFREGDGVAVGIMAGFGIGQSQATGAVLGLLAGPGPAGSRAVVVPPGVRGYDEKIAEAARQKDAAIDAHDFERAAALRETEKRMLAERAQRIEEWSASVDVLALGEELDRLQHEVARLQDLLLRHGLQPGDGHKQTA